MKRILLGLLLSSASGGLLATEACKIFKIRQEDIPFVTPEPGKYLLCEDITWEGTGPAITVNQDRVELCLFAHSIRLTDPSATGILVHNPTRRICEININNDAIINESPATQAGNGIHVDNACKVRIHNIFTINHINGLLIENSSDVIVESCNFSRATRTGTFVDSSDSVVFQRTTFSDNFLGLFLSDAKDSHVSTCSFPNSEVVNVFLQDSRGVHFKECSFSPTAAAGGTLIFAARAQDTLIEGSTFRSGPNESGSLFWTGSGLTVDSCLFDLSTNNPGPFVHILIDVPGNGLITRSIFQGRGVLAADELRSGIVVLGSGTIIQDCLAEGLDIGIGVLGTGNTVRTSTARANRFAGILVQGSSNAVINSTSCMNGQDGISVLGFEDAPTTLHTLSGNILSQNNLDGLFALFATSCTISDNEALGNSENGIELAASSTNNNIQYNRVHSNTLVGITDGGAAGNNEYFYNTSHSNTGLEYSANIPTQQAPGVPTKEAPNITA